MARRSLEAPALVRLRAALAPLPPGACTHVEALTALLVGAWPYLHGANAREMTREKLGGRVTNLVWTAPVLSFDVARGTARDARSEAWQVDLQDGTAWVPNTARLELPPKVAASELAIGLVRKILDGTGSLAVVPKPAGGIAIRPGDVPGLDVGFAETLPGRHRRFRAALDEAMAEAGFVRLGPYRFRHGSTDAAAARPAQPCYK